MGAKDPGDLRAGQEGIAPVPRLGDGDDVESPGGQSRVLGGALDGGDARECPAQLLQHVGGRVHRDRVQAAPGQQRRELPGSGAQVRGVLRPGGNQPVGRIAGVARAHAFVVLPAVLEALPELLAPFPMQFGATACHVRSPSAGPDGYLSNLPHAAGAAMPRRFPSGSQSWVQGAAPAVPGVLGAQCG